MEDTDREFLCWICERLELVHGDNPNTDFMRRLRAIIVDFPPYVATDVSSGLHISDAVALRDYIKKEQVWALKMIQEGITEETLEQFIQRKWRYVQRNANVEKE